MSRVPHASFLADFGDGSHEAPGRAFAQRLAAALLQLGFDSAPPEPWRDVGWTVTGSSTDESFEVLLSRIEDKADPDGEHEYLLAVSPRRMGSWWSNLFGKHDAEHDDDLRRVAEAVHRELVATGAKHVEWFWNGIPRALESAPTPDQLSWSA
jgi:hypothetical protein